MPCTVRNTVQAVEICSYSIQRERVVYSTSPYKCYNVNSGIQGISQYKLLLESQFYPLQFFGSFQDSFRKLIIIIIGVQNPSSVELTENREQTMSDIQLAGCNELCTVDNSVELTVTVVVLSVC